MVLKLLTVVGARPQFIKAAAVSRVIKTKGNGLICEKIVHTGQHFDRDMSDVFFEQLGIPKVAVNLGLGGKGHGEFTGNALIALEQEMISDRPDMVLVYGDTNSTLAAALAASKLQIPIAHVEAGLRSYNQTMPEEINRVLTDHVSTLLFAPSEKSFKILKNEGVRGRIENVGDVMCDMFMSAFPSVPSYNVDVPFVLVTLHRPGNVDNRETLEVLLRGISELGMKVVFPMHPRTRQKVKEFGLSLGSNVEIQGPSDYFGMLSLLKSCEFVITDSGGLQKESYFCEKKCLVARNETEWEELVEIDACRLVGNDLVRFKSGVKWAAENSHFPKKKVYGHGDSSEKIFSVMMEYFK